MEPTTAPSPRTRAGVPGARPLPALAALLAVACAGGAPAEPPFPPEVAVVLAAPETFEILALDPVPVDASGAEGETFHGYPVLGRTALSSEERRAELLASIYAGIRASDGTVAACFNPRHGVHAARGGTTVDLVICFECLSLQVHGPGGQNSRTTTSAVEARVSEIYTESGLELAPR